MGSFSPPLHSENLRGHRLPREPRRYLSPRLHRRRRRSRSRTHWISPTPTWHSAETAFSWAIITVSPPSPSKIPGKQGSSRQLSARVVKATSRFMETCCSCRSNRLVAGLTADFKVYQQLSAQSV